jgi:hypothetical protein
MHTTHNNPALIKCLKDAGIQPISFAFFLVQFMKSKPKSRNPLNKLLIKQLQGQAELMHYHLRERI